MRPLITVVIPVYNRENTIKVCIESILESLYANIEIIIVDDGSTDNTLKVCNELATRDRRIKIISQPNNGVSAARNTGLSHAKGDWISFIDSDDAVDKDYYNYVMSIPNVIKYDLIWVGHTFGEVINEKIIIENKQANYHTKDLDGNFEIVDWIFNGFNPWKNQFFNVWDKLFRVDILRSYNLEFDSKITLAEDQIFVLNYLKYTNRLFYTNQSFYITLRWSHKDRPSGLGGKLRTPEYYLFIQKANYLAFENLYQHYPCQGLKIYQVNYIFDRPITRILYKYLTFVNINKCSYRRLKRLFRNELRPFLLAEKENLNLLIDPQIKQYANMALSRPFIWLYVNVVFKYNCKYYYKRLKRIIRQRKIC